MAESLLPAVAAVTVNPGTQTSEPIVVVSLDAPSQMITNSSCGRAHCCLLTLVPHRPLAVRARADIAAATAAVAAAAEEEDDTDNDDRPASLSSVCARTPARRGSKLPAPPTTGKPNVWLSGLLKAPSLPSTSDVSPRRTAPVAGGEPGRDIRPRTSSMLDRDAPPMPWIRLCARARPSASGALDTETWELCRELPPLPEPEPELSFRDRERERKAPPIRVREVALPLREPSRDALGLG